MASKALCKSRKNALEGLQLEVQELLRQLGRDNCGPRPAFVVAAMKAVMQLEGIQPVINNSCDHLPDRFQEPDTTVVAATLWN